MSIFYDVGNERVIFRSILDRLRFIGYESLLRLQFAEADFQISSYHRPENTHLLCKGKYHWTAVLSQWVLFCLVCPVAYDISNYSRKVLF